MDFYTSVIFLMLICIILAREIFLLQYMFLSLKVFAFGGQKRKCCLLALNLCVSAVPVVCSEGLKTSVFYWL